MTHKERIASIEAAVVWLEKNTRHGPKISLSEVRFLLDRLAEASSLRDKLLTACQALVAADNCNYDRDAMRYEGMFDAARAAIAQTEKPE